MDDTRGIGRTLNNLAVVARDQCEWERMAGLADEALGVSEQIHDPEGVALALISRGIVEGIRGNPVRQQSCCIEASPWRWSSAICARL